MSLEIPLLLNGRSVNNLGSEFDKIADLDRDRGLINPVTRDPPIFNAESTEINLSGIDNQNVLFENNFDPSEEMSQTDAQAQLFLQQVASLSAPVTNEEKRLDLTEDFDLDPRLRRDLMVSSTLSGSNIFSQQSQDFVREIQDSVKNFNDEQNLYIALVPTTQTRAGLRRELDGGRIKTQDAGALASIESALRDIGRSEREQVKARQKRRKDILPTRKPTQEEKIVPEPAQPQPVIETVIEAFPSIFNIF